MAKKIRQTTAAKPNSLSPHAQRSERTQPGGSGSFARPSLSKRGRAAASINKSAFVRSLPSSLSAAEVIAKGKTKGIKLSAAQVYTIRANARRKGPELPVNRGRGDGARSARELALRTPRGRGGEAKEAEFIAAALDLGLARAEALIRALRAKASAGWS
jgi:hypothetical protein